MSEDQTENAKSYDPLEPFRGMRDVYLDAVAKTMVEAVNTDAYAQAAGAMLDSSLTMSAPFREALEKTMLQVLQQLSLPSRQDVLALAERFTNLELRLDDMDACLSGFEGMLQKSMLPILQHQLLLTERFTSVSSRLDALDAKLGRGSARALPVKQATKRVKTQIATRVTAKSHAAKKPARPAKAVQPTKRAARRGAR